MKFAVSGVFFSSTIRLESSTGEDTLLGLGILTLEHTVSLLDMPETELD